MKAIFISYDQAHYEKVLEVLEKYNSRGFTAWELVKGRGSKTGEPHFGSHAWPSMAGALIAVVEDHRVQPILDLLKQIDEEKPKLGLRAWTWNIESSI